MCTFSVTAVTLKANCLQKPEKESELNIHNYKVKTHTSQGGSHSCTMKYLENVLLLGPGWDASPSHGYGLRSILLVPT